MNYYPNSDSVMEDLLPLINELAETSRRCGLRLNILKTKVIRNCFTASREARLKGEQYVYLGRLVSMTDNFNAEMKQCATICRFW